jgi:hypothetical protein
VPAGGTPRRVQCSPTTEVALGSVIDAVALVGKRSVRSGAERVPSRVLAGFGRVVVAALGRHRRRRHEHADRAAKVAATTMAFKRSAQCLSTLALAARLALRTVAVAQTRGPSRAVKTLWACPRTSLTVIGSRCS